MRSAASLGKHSWHMLDGRAHAMYRELQALGMPRANLFLVGPRSVTQDLLELLMPDLEEPVATWFPGEPLVLPLFQIGTMIFYDVGALAWTDQLRLRQHLEDRRVGPQIISTSSTPLFPRVYAGTFEDTLYYHLNQVCLDLSGPGGAPLS